MLCWYATVCVRCIWMNWCEFAENVCILHFSVGCLDRMLSVSCKLCLLLNNILVKHCSSTTYFCHFWLTLLLFLPSPLRVTTSTTSYWQSELCSVLIKCYSVLVTTSTHLLPSTVCSLFRLQQNFNVLVTTSTHLLPFTVCILFRTWWCDACNRWCVPRPQTSDLAGRTSSRSSR